MIHNYFYCFNWSSHAQLWAIQSSNHQFGWAAILFEQLLLQLHLRIRNFIVDWRTLERSTTVKIIKKHFRYRTIFDHVDYTMCNDKYENPFRIKSANNSIRNSSNSQLDPSLENATKKYTTKKCFSKFTSLKKSYCNHFRWLQKSVWLWR